MDYDWYTVEQEIRDRLFEARESARIRRLTQDRTAGTAHSGYAKASVTGLAKWASALVRHLRVDRSRADGARGGRHGGSPAERHHRRA